MNQYTKQAKDFLKATKTRFKIAFVEHGEHFVDDTETRDIFKASFTRDNRSFSVRFGQSIALSTCTGAHIPNEYDVLACLTKFPVDSFNTFCDDFGYNMCTLSDYPKVKKIYNAVKKEYANVCKIWDAKEIKRLQSIN